MRFSSPFAAVQIRPAQPADQLALSNLFHFEPYNFRHLDWKRPIEWLGQMPFLVAEQRGRIVAALVCPPEPPGVAWIRAFAASGQIQVGQVWRTLWQEAHAILTEQGKVQVAALCSEGWMQRLLEKSGFRQVDEVVVLSWDSSTPLQPPRVHLRVRSMELDDLPQVNLVDQACFEPIWQTPPSILELAFHQALFATVAEDDAGIVGYQISTPNLMGGHLARLGVHPRAQGQGMGYALVYDLLQRFISQGRPQVTVNTQAGNKASLAVYRKANFHFMGYQYPVYVNY